MTCCVPFIGIGLGHVTCFDLWNLSRSDICHDRAEALGPLCPFSSPQDWHISRRVLSFMLDPARKRPCGAEPQPSQPTYNMGETSLCRCRPLGFRNCCWDLTWWSWRLAQWKKDSIHGKHLEQCLEHMRGSRAIITTDVLWLLTWLPNLHSLVFN